jgi:predicted nuclease of predicted toxin-antitoxin system
VRLLLDEMLSPVIARQLRARGHDVESVAGKPAREALPDPEVLALARAEHRALITSNLRDFRPLHHEAITLGGAGHYGMIFIPGNYRRTRADIGKIIAALEAILTQYSGERDLANGEAWL